MGESFLKSKDKGRTGEEFVIKHLDKLTTNEIVHVVDTSTKKISGKDCVATTADDHEMSVEVKTVWNFLTRTNDGEEPTGTLCFELWKNDKRTMPGWLIEMVYPERFTKAVRADIFVFLLVAYQNVFASIAFENTEELTERLEDLAFRQGFDLGKVPCNAEADNWQPDGASIIDNMWYLPFSLLADLATVTIIGNKPRIRPDIRSGNKLSRICTTNTQERRYGRLVSASGERVHMEADGEFDRAFTGDIADDVFAIVDLDLNVLEKTDFDACYPNLSKYNKSKGSVLDCLGYILFRMLAHEYPSREQGGQHYFPIAYDIVINWSKKHGYETGPITWYRNLKYAEVFGLMRYFRPWKTSENPIDEMVNANNISPKSVGYYAPVELTRDVLIKAEAQAHNYFYDGVKTSQISKDVLIGEEKDFEKVDRIYGRDGRKIAKAKDYVHELYLRTITIMVYEKCYALPAEVCNTVKKTMKKEKRLWTVPKEKILTEAGKTETDRQRPYWREFKRLENNMSGLARELAFVTYKQLSEEDKVWLEGTENLRTGIYIIRDKDIPWDVFKEVRQFRDEKRKKENEKRRRKYAQKKAVHV